MSSTLELPYAIRAGQVVGIADVESGLRRDCSCPVCGYVLVAKKGNKVRHHFAHHRDSGCANAPETLLHMAAKQVIEQARQLMLPAVWLSFQNVKPAWELSAAQIITIDDVRLESPIGTLVPDLIVSVRDRLLAIEVTVTHRTCDEKVRRLSQAGCSVLEIDLSKQPRFLSLEELTTVVVRGVEHKTWRHNRLAEAVRQDVLQLCEHKKTITRGFALHVDNCPIPARVWRGKPYANVIDDCWNCEHCVATEHSDAGETTSILCLGRRNVRTYEQWRVVRRPRSVRGGGD